MSLLIDASIFKRNRNFFLLFVGQFASFFGTMITHVALPYQMYQETHSTSMVGLLSLAQLVPLVITGLVGGVWADRYPRRFLLFASEFVLMLTTLFLAWNSWTGSVNPWTIIALGLVMSAVTGLHRPALESLSQQLVEPSDYATVAAWRSFKGAFCMIAGPFLAGLIISYSLTAAYVLDVLTFAIALYTLFAMSHIPAPVKDGVKHEPILLAIRSSLTYARSRQELVGSYLIDIVAMFFAVPNALFPAMAEHLGGAPILGLMYAAPAVGSLVISFFSGWTLIIKRYGAAISVSAALCGAAIIGFGLSTHILPALFFLFLYGAFDAVSGIFRLTLWNETISMDMRGRMAGIEMISYLSGPKLGDARAGFTASLVGSGFSLVFGGIACVIGVGVCTYYLPEYWKYRKR